MAAEGAGGGAWWRWAGAVLLLALALHSLRTALVGSDGATRPALALAVWPGHPVPSFAAALAGIGSAARQGRSPDRATLALAERGARQAPLAPEPLWIAAAARMEAGDLKASERLLTAAVRLDPRAPAARFLLADLSLRQGRLGEAMDQLAVLERRVGGVSAGFTPALLRYLSQPGGAERLGPALGRNPALRARLLGTLAADPAARPLLLALAGPGDAQAEWFAAALQRLLAEGDIESARALHARAVPGGTLGGTLQPWRAAPTANPFEWRFPAARGGVAEPTSEGPLRIIHYGREESRLAEHLLTLSPGRYRLSQRFAGDVPPRALEWHLACQPGTRRIGLLAAARAGAADIEVPPDCAVQRLTLVGRPGDIASTVRADLLEVTLDPLGSASR